MMMTSTRLVEEWRPFSEGIIDRAVRQWCVKLCSFVRETAAILSTVQTITYEGLTVELVRLFNYCSKQWAFICWKVQVQLFKLLYLGN